MSVGSVSSVGATATASEVLVGSSIRVGRSALQDSTESSNSGSGTTATSETTGNATSASRSATGTDTTIGAGRLGSTATSALDQAKLLASMKKNAMTGLLDALPQVSGIGVDSQLLYKIYDAKAVTPEIVSRWMAKTGQLPFSSGSGVTGATSEAASGTTDSARATDSSASSGSGSPSASANAVAGARSVLGASSGAGSASSGTTARTSIVDEIFAKYAATSTVGSGTLDTTA